MSLNTIADYELLANRLQECKPEEKIAICRYLARTDLFFLLWFVLGRRDIARQWLFERCKEIEANPNGFLDLWAREHYKSTIITYGLSIQDIISSHGEDPLPKWQGKEATIGIFSCTRPIAKSFLRQIKRELESNDILKALFPDVIWENPWRDAPKWSEDDGLVLKRKSNPKESTVEAWGLVDGQPTSKHFLIRVYDDMVTIENVRSPDMISKTTEAWELSTNLGAAGGVERYIGTRYHFNDTYRSIMQRQAAIPRVYAATEDGTPAGKPVLLEAEELAKKRREMGGYTFACQMLQNPKADETEGFIEKWLKYYDNVYDGAGMNLYMLCDPAGSKKKENDYTVIAVIGLGSDQNYYLIDMIRDRLNLTQRTEQIFKFHRKYRPLNTGYEKYGKDSDIEHIQFKQNKENYRFNIEELGGPMPKNDRIKQLIPIFEQGRFYLPQTLYKTDYEGKLQDLVDVFIHQEYKAFPVSVHDDMLDCIARILHPSLAAIFPEPIKEEDYSYKKVNKASAWAA